jgi:hypothetical protein
VVLRATVPQIAELTAGLGADALQAAPGRGEWSANEVIAHLRACADVWGGCMAAILAQERPTIQAVSPRTWIESTNYPELKFRSSFRAFAKQRADLLAVLEALSRGGWSRTATVTGAGRPREWTVLKYAVRMALHERTHLRQVQRIVGAVGVGRSHSSQKRA